MARTARPQPVSPTVTPQAAARRGRGRNNDPSAPPAVVADLSPNPKNPRKPWEEGRREKFAASLREFGDLSGVVFNATTGQLVGGHKRVEEFKAAEGAQLQVAERLATPDAAGTVAYGHVLLPDGTRFAYREVRWSKGKEAAANLAANKWAAEWDFDAMGPMLAAVPKGFDIELTGFTAGEASGFLATPEDALPFDGEEHTGGTFTGVEEGAGGNPAEDSSIRYLQLIYSSSDYAEVTRLLNVVRKALAEQLEARFGEEEAMTMPCIFWYLLERAAGGE